MRLVPYTPRYNNSVTELEAGSGHCVPLHYTTIHYKRLHPTAIYYTTRHHAVLYYTGEAYRIHTIHVCGLFSWTN